MLIGPKPGEDNMDKNRTFPLKKVRIYDSSKNKMSYLSMGYHLIKQSMGDPVLATYSYESKTGIYPIYMLEVKEASMSVI